MKTTYYHRSPHAQYRVTLIPLYEYEDQGGTYDDGQTCTQPDDQPFGPADFACAAEVQEKDGDDWGPADVTAWGRAEGVEFWRNAATGALLLFGWPASAPLDARYNASR